MKKPGGGSVTDSVDPTCDSHKKIKNEYKEKHLFQVKLTQEQLDDFYETMKAYVLPFNNYDIPRITKPSAVEFYREYVSKNRPCIITDLCDDWNCLSNWQSDEYLINQLGDTVSQ